MENDLPLIKEIVIDDPPTYWDLVFKKPKYDKEGKLITHSRYYLTANLFYSDKGSYHITQNIVNDCKMWLYEKIRGLPELEKMRIEVEYNHIKHIDVDNKIYFWVKLLLDVLKKPTQKQIDSTKRYKKQIITTNTIYDDSSKYIDDIRMTFKNGQHRMIIRIFGRVANEQSKINLFTNI